MHQGGVKGAPKGDRAYWGSPRSVGVGAKWAPRGHEGRAPLVHPKAPKGRHGTLMGANERSRGAGGKGEAKGASGWYFIH